MRQVTEPATALLALGHLYLMQGFPKQALALVMAARKAGAAEPCVPRLLATAYLDMGRPDRALELMDEVEAGAQPGPERRAASFLRARALLGVGRAEDARAVFEQGGRHA